MNKDNKRPVRILSVIQLIDTAFGAMKNCQDTGNHEWESYWRDVIRTIEKEWLPSGSGFDSGTTFDGELKDGALSFVTAFHHMNEVGMYNGWTNHHVTVRPTFTRDLDIYVHGRNRNGIKDFIAEQFHHALTEKVEWVVENGETVIRRHVERLPAFFDTEGNVNARFKIKDDHSLMLNYQRSDDTLVLDIVHKDETGGCEIFRGKLDPARRLSHLGPDKCVDCGSEEIDSDYDNGDKRCQPCAEKHDAKETV